MKLFAFGLVISAAFFGGAVASLASEKRSVSAHEHGHGKVTIVADGNALVVELEIPGADIAGFEGVAKNDGERAKIRNASEILSDGKNVIRFPDEAGCVQQDAGVEVEADADHSEFHVTYLFSCTSVQAIDKIAFPFFKQFPESEELDLKAILPRGPVSGEIERDEPEISF